jgi:TRAP-type C4-dicarboxylate transport system substrate-binding protein
MKNTIVRRLMLLLFAIFSVALFAEGSKESASSDKVYKFAAGMTPADGTFQAMFWNDFKEIVEERSNGRIEVTLHYSASMGNDTEMLQKTLLDSIQAANGATANWGNSIPQLKTFDLPYVVDEPEDYEIFYDENWNIAGPVGDYFQEILAERGLRAMFFNPFQFRQVNLKDRLVKKPSDMVGIKMRTSASALERAILESFGATTVPMGISEVYTALQQGTVDGATLGPVLAQSFKFPEVAPYFSMVNFQPLTVFGMTSLKFYNSLPEDLQTIFDEACAEVSARGMDYLRQSQADTMKQLETMDIKYFYPTPEELQVFKDAAQPIYDTFGDEVDQDLLEIIRQAEASR